MRFIFSLLQIHNRSGQWEHMKKSQVGWLLCGKTLPGTSDQRWTGHLQHRVGLLETGRLDDWTWCVGCQQFGIASAGLSPRQRFWVQLWHLDELKKRSKRWAHKKTEADAANRFKIKIRNKWFGTITSQSSETHEPEDTGSREEAAEKSAQWA